ncbi:MAG: glycosyltransferase family 2 protein [Acidimicrobiales bacterium]
MSVSSLVLVAAGLAAGVALCWRVPTLPPGPPSRTRVSVVIPARNEAGSLPRLLSSLAAQHQPPLEVLVVDDGSTDATADVARAAGARVIAAPPPPDGWLGKPWACHTGASAAAGERVLFLDADTWLAPDALRRLVAAHDATGSDGLLSVQPYHVVERPFEHLSAVCNTVPVLAAGIAAVRPRHSARVAFGPCLLTGAADLVAVGGFATVAGEVVEDAALARAYAATGRRVQCRAGGDAVRFRMYPDGRRSLAEGWTKNLAGGAARVAWVPLLGAIAWVSAGLAVTFGAELSPTFGVAYVAFAGELWWMLRRLGSFHPLTAVLFPIPLLAFTYLFLRSVAARALRRPVRWRGRAIDVRRGVIR